MKVVSKTFLSMHTLLLPSLIVLSYPVSDHLKDNILRSKFNSYDSNGDGMIRLENTEENRFHSDLYQFAWCKHFLYHISDIIDANNTDSITYEEWKNFFFIDHTSRKPNVTCMM